MSGKSDPTSDERLYKTILARFAADRRTESASLRVGVLHGIVHLAGEVAKLETRLLAAELAGSLPGVRGVVNRIEAPGAPLPAREVNLDLQGK